MEWGGEVRKGAAEVGGVAQPVLAEFSKRRREMQQMAQEGGIGLGSKAAAESAALATRDRKQYGVETHTWREEVRARAGELGLGSAEIADLLRAGRERAVHGVRAESGLYERRLGDWLAGADGLTGRSNTFDLGAVLREFAQDAQQGARVEDVRGQAARFAQRGDVLETDRQEMTTADLVASERQLVASATGRGGEETAIVDPMLVERTIVAVPPAGTFTNAEYTRRPSSC